MTGRHRFWSGVDRETGIWQHAATDHEVTGIEAAGIERLGVLPEPLVTYIEWNHKAWGRPGIDEDGEVAPFDPDPGFWETVLEAGMPASWKDRGNRAALEAEASNRGVPLIPMEDIESRMPETQAIPLGVEGRVVPKAQPRAGAAKRTPRKRPGSGATL